MNVLLLTPDAVGGTLLERMLAIYSHINPRDRPTIDVGHVELGLATYFNTEFNQMILRSLGDYEFRDMQNLPQIQALLQSVDHYKILKLPHYNMVLRQDPRSQQVPFYRYLDQNYFVISCRRDNLFEHALSWSINKITKNLNVFTPQEKIKHFVPLYASGIHIDPLSVRQSLEDYRRYLDWCDNNFHVSSYYVYEQHMPNLEKYILSLPMFAQSQAALTWHDVWGQEFADWNQCHYLSSDIGSLFRDPMIGTKLRDLTGPTSQSCQVLPVGHDAIKALISSYQRVRDHSWPDISDLSDWHTLPDTIKQECLHLHDLGFYVDSAQLEQNKNQGLYDTTATSMTTDLIPMIQDTALHYHKGYLAQHGMAYQRASSSIEKMIDIGILRSGIPIKKQTMREKYEIIKNMPECLDMYNQWISQNPGLGSRVQPDDICRQAHDAHWHGIGRQQQDFLLEFEPDLDQSHRS